MGVTPVVYMTGNPPSPPIKKTPLVGVFFIGSEGHRLNSPFGFTEKDVDLTFPLGT
jgi:hypothetical protein